MEPLYSPLIEVAGDGQTAKGLWSCLGAHNEVGGAGPVANWTWGYFAADFVKEGDGWKIWHLQYLNDVDCICGQSWGKPQQPLSRSAGVCRREGLPVPRLYRGPAGAGVLSPRPAPLTPDAGDPGAL